MTDSPLFTEGDVEFLRREADRHERWAKKNDGDGSCGNVRKARKLRALADKIERSLRGEAA